MKNIATLLSGGVDSSVVVHLLCEQGYKPDLFYIKIGMDNEDMGCSAEEDIELAQATAHKYGLPLEVIDLQKEYWDSVVQYTIDKVSKGYTPNPDVMCNKLVKFGCFEDKVGHNYDFTATGHYATRIEEDGEVWLGTAKDPLKDQTDFLAQISKLQVSKLLFPLGGYVKDEVRQIALKAKLPSAYRKDSQGICFLGKIDYNSFVKRFLGEKEGAIVELETGKILGKHQGFWFHTIGQRKGLGLAGGPWYVVSKDIDQNIVYVSKGYDTQTQYGTDFYMDDFNFITLNPWKNPGKDRTEVKFKIRHTPEFTTGHLTKKEGRYHLESTEKLQGIAPGQFGVIYDTDARICYGSGEIAF